MKTDQRYDGVPAPDGDAVERTKRERYHQSVRSHESREAEIKERLQARRQSVEELRQRVLSLLDALESEHKADRGRIKRKLEQAKVRLEAAHHAAEEICAQIGLRYAPGETTDEDVLRVPRLEDAEAARRLGLPFGPSISFLSGRAAKILKPLLMAICWVASSLSLGLLFRIVTPRDIVTAAVLAHPLSLGLALTLGGMVALGLALASGWWRVLGTKVGAGRPEPEVRKMLIPMAAITAVLFLGLAYLDARAAVLLNAARAALDPAYAVPMAAALLFGGLLSAIYLLGLAGTAFAAGYNAAAREAVNALVKTDESARREERKRKTPVVLALEAQAAVKVAEEIIRGIKEDLDRREGEFKREWAELAGSLPERPTAPEADEAQELNDLRHRVRSAKAHHDAYLMSRTAIDAEHDATDDHTD